MPRRRSQAGVTHRAESPYSACQHKVSRAPTPMRFVTTVLNKRGRVALAQLTKAANAYHNELARVRPCTDLIRILKGGSAKTH